MDSELLKRIENHKWYHEFDFGEGIVTKSVLPASFKRTWEATENLLDKVDFRGKSVLDIGCWDGYWSFYAERKGASYVLATDMNTQRWEQADGTLRPATVSENEGFCIAHKIYKSKVEYRGDVSVYELNKLLRRFDVVLFLGVYYHLTHIMYGLTQVRHAVEPDGVVIIEGGAIDDTQRSYTDFYFFDQEGNEPYRKDASNWFLPTRRCIKDMVESNYFKVTDQIFVPDIIQPEPAPPKSQKDLQKEKWQSRIARVFDIPVEKPPEPVRYGRMLIRATPERRVDRRHFYEPQFGLSQYDPRFSDF